MNADPKISWRVVSSLVIGVIVLLVGLIGFINRSRQEAPLVDNGPNARLSNQELVNKAVTNMRQLRAYHMEFSGPVMLDRSPGVPMTLLADVQLPERGLWLVREGAPGQGSKFWMSLGARVYQWQQLPAPEWEIRWASDGKLYESTNGGKTWEGSSLDLLTMTFGCYFECGVFEQYWGPAQIEGTPTVMASSPLTFTDGSPRLEKRDGVVTRHVVADVSGISAEYGPWSEPPTKLDLWVSTEITPTIRKLVMRGTGGTSAAFNALGSPTDLALSRDGRTLAAAYDARELALAYENSNRSGPAPESPGAVRVWDLTKPATAPRVLPTGQSLSWVSLSADGRILAAGSSWNGAPYVWDLAAQNPVSTTILPAPLPDDAADPDVFGGLGNIAVRADGQMVAAITRHSFNIWESPAGQTKPPLFSDPSVNWLSESILASSPDNKTLAVSVDDRIRLYDWRNPTAPPRELPLAAGTPRAGPVLEEMAFSPDGNLLAGFDRDALLFWDLRESNPSPTFIPGAGPYSGGIAFGSPGNLLAIGANERMVQIWSVDSAGGSRTTPTRLLELDAGNALSSLAFSADGKYLVAATKAGPVLLWSLEDLGIPAKAKTPPEAQVLVGSEAGEIITDKPYTLTWTWSRFNEDFGEVKPPPTETIQQP